MGNAALLRHRRYTRTFLKELADLPPKERERVEKVVFGEAIQHDPFLSGRVQKLAGYQEYYKLRIGRYRVGIRLDFEERIVQFRRVLHRKDIYREFP